MKKAVSKMFSLLLVCMVFASMVTSVSAAEIDQAPLTAQAGRQVLAMTAVKVNDRLFSKVSNKQFTTADLSGSYLTLSGTITHTYGGSFRASVCYLENGTHETVPGLTATTSPLSGFKLISGLTPGVTYWGCIRNLDYNPNDSANYVHGNLAVMEY